MGNAIPKCTSWRGHKFEGRYNETPTAFKTGGIVTEQTLIRLVELSRTRVYVCDVCVRCGHTTLAAKEAINVPAK